MANDATYKRWEELLNPKIVKERFAKAGLLVMAYEMLEEASLVGFEIFLQRIRRKRFYLQCRV